AERVNAAGNVLRGLGVQTEQRVLLAMLDTIDFPAMFLGAIKAGIVPVPLNTLLKPPDYAHFVRDSRARAVVVSDALLPVVGPALDGAGIEVVVATTPLGGDRGAHRSLDALMASAARTL